MCRLKQNSRNHLGDAASHIHAAIKPTQKGNLEKAEKHLELAKKSLDAANATAETVFYGNNHSLKETLATFLNLIVNFLKKIRQGNLGNLLSPITTFHKDVSDLHKVLA